MEDEELSLYEILAITHSAIAIFERLLFHDMFVANPYVFTLPPIVEESHLNSIRTLITKYSDIVATKGKGDKNLLQTLHDLNKDYEQFETIVKGLCQNNKDQELRGQLLPQAYQLVGRFQQMQYAASEAAPPIKYSGFGDFITDFPTLEPSPQWLTGVTETLSKCSNDTLQRMHASIASEPIISLIYFPKEDVIHYIMKYLTADTPEDRYVIWLRSVGIAISHYKNAVLDVSAIQQRASLGCELKIYSARLAKHAQAQKSKDKYTKHNIQQFSVAELKQVLSEWGWGSASAGGSVRDRVLGFLEDPFFCDREVFSENNNQFNLKLESLWKDADCYRKCIKTKDEMLTLLANPVACPKQQAKEFQAKLQGIYKYLPPVRSTRAPVTNRPFVSTIAKLQGIYKYLPPVRSTPAPVTNRPFVSTIAPQANSYAAPPVTRPIFPQTQVIPTTSTLTIPPDLRIDYAAIRLENQIGEGSYAKVWKAVWMQNIPVAVKQITFQAATPKAISSIEKEITLAARVRHPNVVSIYGVCQLSASEFWLVLEYADQGCLYEILANHSEDISWNQKWKWAKEAASAVAYLHQLGIIHRDIKSPNFLVSKGSLKICDFGMSTTAAVASNVISTVSGRPKIGTVRWIAPECTNNNSMDTKSDMYALGMVLWEIASREIPFSDILNDMHVMVRVKYEDLRPEIGDEWPPVYSSIMQQCWIGNPAERPNADELVLSLNDASPDSF